MSVPINRPVDAPKQGPPACDVLIGIPMSEPFVNFEWAMTIGKVRYSHGISTRVIAPPEPQIDVARNEILDTAIGNNIPYVFMLDSDVLPPYDVIPRLLKHFDNPDVAVVSGVYARRHVQFWNEMLIEGEDAEGKPGLIPIAEGAYLKGDTLEVDTVGTGCVMLKTNIIRSIERPYFFWTTYYTLPGYGRSEDFQFFKKVRRHGIKVLVDTSVVCGHIATAKIYPSRGAVGNFSFYDASQLW